MPKDKLIQNAICVERDQLSHGRLIHVVSLFPEDGKCTPEDKLKTLIDMDLKKRNSVPEGVDFSPIQS